MNSPRIGAFRRGALVYLAALAGVGVANQMTTRYASGIEIAIANRGQARLSDVRVQCGSVTQRVNSIAAGETRTIAFRPRGPGEPRVLYRVGGDTYEISQGLNRYFQELYRGSLRISIAGRGKLSVEGHVSSPPDLYLLLATVRFVVLLPLVPLTIAVRAIGEFVG